MEQYKKAIDWEWENHGPPAEFKCVLDVINFSLEDAIKDLKDTVEIRGNKTANECVVEAIKSKRAGDRSKALRWLMAGQCHNPEHRRDIKNAGDAAIDYAESQYGSQIP